MTWFGKTKRESERVRENLLSRPKFNRHTHTPLLILLRWWRHENEFLVRKKVFLYPNFRLSNSIEVLSNSSDVFNSILLPVCVREKKIMKNLKQILRKIVPKMTFHPWFLSFNFQRQKSAHVRHSAALRQNPTRILFSLSSFYRHRQNTEQCLFILPPLLSLCSISHTTLVCSWNVKM